MFVPRQEIIEKSVGREENNVSNPLGVSTSRAARFNANLAGLSPLKLMGESGFIVTYLMSRHCTNGAVTDTNGRWSI